MKYKITVVETLKKVYYIEAEDEIEAEDILDSKFNVNEDDMDCFTCDSYTREYITEKEEEN